jgi:alkanesulfonate monooxygenase SsuD/methylene tetrahydromethanopterin reductase-like flavin-dependent oxidoreductase (luciferase family)
VDVGIGLPNAVAGTKGQDLIEFARRADAAGFSSLGTIDRLVYDSYESIAALAAAAAVTERIRLMPSVLLGPLRTNAALLAKQIASVHALSAGRFILGISVGGREDDYEASGVPMSERGKRIDAFLETANRVWSGESFGAAGGIGPEVSDDPPKVIVGGGAQASFERAAKHGVGWIFGGGPPERFAEGREKAIAAWKEAGRDGEPRTAALAYYALGPNAEKSASQDLLHYYGWLGEETAEMIAGGAATDADTVQQYIQAFSDTGCDELVLFATSSDPDQVDLLAEVAL